MKFLPLTVALVASTSAFTAGPAVHSRQIAASSSSLNMVLEKPAAKKISKLEALKVNSKNLIHPLKEVRTIQVFFSWPSQAEKASIQYYDRFVAIRCDEVILSPSDRYMQTQRKALSREPVDFFG